jgi:FkbM family methyltransferase
MMNLSRLVRHWRRAPELFRVRRESPVWKDIVSHYLNIGSPAYPFQIPLRSGATVQTNSRNELEVFWQIFVRRCYPLPPDCATIVDAGANIGLFALFAARERPNARIISLEPFPQTFQLLEQNIRANSLEGRVLALQQALADSTGMRQMIAFGESPTNRVVLHGMEDLSKPAQSVQSITLADLLEKHELETLDLLKMDVEGSEWEILFSTPASVLRRIGSILLEYHEVHARFGYKPEQLFSYMASAGHKLNYREEDAGHTGLAFFTQARVPA